MKKFLLMMMMACFALCVSAQSAGDKLFQQGQRFQMTQTMKAQKQAIAKFSAARKAYDSAEKKAMCSNQIMICRNNIAMLGKKSSGKTKVVVVRRGREDNSDKKEEAKEEEKEPVSLSLSVSAVEFKGSGKKNDNHQVTVYCNYDTWTYQAPSWVDITKNGNVLTLTADANDTGEERSDVFIVECEGEKAELMIYQKAKFGLKSLRSMVGLKKKD